jgi:5-methylcytosine-specific restriction endonuclease McrA
MAAEAISRADAKARGLKRYFTGLPCKYGHIEERVVANGLCIACAYEAEKRYKAAHPDKMREKWKRIGRARNSDPLRKEAVKRNRQKWIECNPDKEADRQKRWRDENREHVRERERRLRDKNIERYQAKHRRWRDENRDDPEFKQKAIERVRRWNEENPEGKRRNSQRRRARLRNVSGDYSVSEIIGLLEKQRWKCAEVTCRADIRKQRDLDHIIPLTDEENSSNDISNLQWLCPRCNRRKHDKDPVAWARANGRLL